MIKAMTLALGLTLAVPLALSATAFAADSTRQDDAAMHRDMHKDRMGRDRHERRHHAMHARGRDSMDRDEARVTAELNQREMGDNRRR